MLPLWLGLAACAAVPATPAVAVASPPLWGALRAGPHAIGFRQIVAFDTSRVYGRWPEGVGLERAASKTARPVLIDVWYPAVASPAAPRMPYGAYLDWSLRGTPAEAIGPELARYEREQLANETFGVEDRAEPEPAQARAIKALLATEVAARRGAVPGTGSFPLVIYAPGSDGTPDESFVLCEYLASHGYIVAAGSFLAGDAISLGQQSSTADADLDFRFLIHTLHAEPGVDPRRLGLIGFSAGAQDALLFAVGNPVVDAVVSLDTTWDQPANQPTFASNPPYRRFREAAPSAAVPVLAFASKGADFAPFADMKHARRIFVTADDLDHRELMTQGMLGASRRPREGDAPPAAQVRAQYDAVCTYVLQFFEATLSGKPEAAAFLARSPADNGITVQGIHVQRRDAVPRPPRERELLELAIARGAPAAIERCAAQMTSGGDPCDADWLSAVGQGLMARRQWQAAVALLEADLARRPTAVDTAVLLGRAELARGDREAARRAFREALRRAPAGPATASTPLDEWVARFWGERARRALARLDAATPAP